MKKILLSIILSLFICNIAECAAPTRSYIYTSGNTIEPGEVTTNEDNIFTYLQNGVEVFANNSVISGKIADSAVTSAKILDDTILNADINSSAAIAYSKLNLSSSITSSDITDSTIVGGDLSSSIAISTTGLTTVSGIVVNGSFKDGSGSYGTAGQVLTNTSGLTKWTTPATASSGKFVQVVNTQTGTVATGTTLLPFDNTIPQSGEGDQYMTLAITPISATNCLKITVVANCTYSVGNPVGVALFQDSNANAIASQVTKPGAANFQMVVTFVHYMVAGTTSSTTFKVRMGGHTAGTTTFNGSADAGGQVYGGSLASSITIEEMTPN